jgi:hypothetical protein
MELAYMECAKTSGSLVEFQDYLPTGIKIKDMQDQN